MSYKKFNDEVYYSGENITKVTSKEVDFLKEKAKHNYRKRARLCAHVDVSDSVHEMLIVHAKNCYVPPHKHLGKSESFHLIEGQLDVVIFSDDGKIIDVVHMGIHGTDKVFYYRLQESYYHTVIPLTDWVVFHETTKGPFDRSKTLFASWAPEEEDHEKHKPYLTKLLDRISNFK